MHISENEHYNKGLMLFDHGLYAEAIAEFEQALDSASEGDIPERKLASFYICEAYINLGLNHLRMGMHHRAEEDLKLALTIHPEYADLHFYLARVYYREEQYDRAEEQLKKALRVNPKYARALIYLGLVRLKKGKEKGLADISKAVDIEPAYDDENSQLAASLYHSGDIDQAIRLIEEAAEIDVDQVSYLLEKSRKLMKEKAYPEASDALLEAIAICPHYADLRHYLGLCYMRQGMAAPAVEQFTKALEINPAFIMARINLAAAYEKGGEMDLAVGELKHVLSLDPGNHMAERMLSKLSGK